MFLAKTLLITACVLAAGCAPQKHEGPDLILTGGAIYTVDSLQPFVTAMAIRDGRIMAVGADREILAMAGAETEIRDLKGQFVMPGLIEGHGHFRGLGESLSQLNLMDIRTWEEGLEMVSARVQTVGPGTWITGRGWHQEKWDHMPEGAIEGYPTHQSLSMRSPDHPIWLRHASGHAGLANTRAMELAGIGVGTPDPPGGRIVRDAEGVPTGVLEENAMDLVTAALEKARASRTKDEIRREDEALYRAAEEACLALGITSFQDAGSSRVQIDHLRDMAEKGQLRLRLWVMLIEPWARMTQAIEGLPWTGLGYGHLTVRAIKAYMDGALGSHGAWLLAPYADKPGYTGQVVTSPDTLEALARLAADHHLQLCVHAIGDRANREVLDICERTFLSAGGNGHRRWRIEHAQHLDTADIPRFRELGVIASMQPVHCISDAPFVEKRLGADRARSGAYVWRSLLDAGASLAVGTDTPVESVDPFANLYAATTRRRMDNGEPFYPGEVMDRREALYAYTLGNARAAFEEKEKGSLSPGKWADFIIVDRDLTRCSEKELLEARVLRTYLAGKEVYAAGTDSTHH
ncbi:MAG: amidohydrolase [Saprospiraceae bacterium]|nr:amidohydrolase [Saprospiraceae bacterium]